MSDKLQRPPGPRVNVVPCGRQGASFGGGILAPLRSKGAHAIAETPNDSAQQPAGLGELWSRKALKPAGLLQRMVRPFAFLRASTPAIKSAVDP